MTAQDLWSMGRVGAPAVSPDGRSVVYTVTHYDLETDRGRTHLWLVPVAGGEPRQLTHGDASASAPAWSPDGRSIAFVTARGDDGRQIWLMPAAGGEATQLTRVEGGASGPVWSPDGSLLAFTSRVWVEGDEGGEPAASPGGVQVQRPGLRRAHGPALGHVDGRATEPRVRGGPGHGRGPGPDARALRHAAHRAGRLPRLRPEPGRDRAGVRAERGRAHGGGDGQQRVAGAHATAASRRGSAGGMATTCRPATRPTGGGSPGCPRSGPGSRRTGRCSCSTTGGPAPSGR
jgi:hypothetical protein